jgi:hypothetical protein
MAEQRIEFGKRRPLPPPPATPPVKRSGHVALLVMGTLAVGGTAYALMPRQQNCPQQDPAVAGQPQSTECTTRRSGGGSSGGSVRSRCRQQRQRVQKQQFDPCRRRLLRPRLARRLRRLRPRLRLRTWRLIAIAMTPRKHRVYVVSWIRIFDTDSKS